MAAGLTFLTPPGALLTLGVLVPFTVLLVVRRRAREIRGGLGLPEPGLRRLLAAAVALVAASVLVGLAAAQPIVEREVSRQARTDAEVFIVLDVSRSMLAQETVDSPMRLERAKAAASTLRASLPTVRVGLASLTDRVLPHLFPSADANTFEATLDRAIGIERPPPRSGLLRNVTKLDALGAVRGLRFFSPSARKRLVIVLTDGESLAVANARIGTLMRKPPAIETIFVQVWGADERVYSNGAPEPQYEPDPAARAILDRLAAATGGSVYAERDVEAAAGKAAALLGDGPVVVEGEGGHRLALAPYLSALALLPVALLLWRRDR